MCIIAHALDRLHLLCRVYKHKHQREVIQLELLTLCMESSQCRGFFRGLPGRKLPLVTWQILRDVLLKIGRDSAETPDNADLSVKTEIMTDIPRG
jgi:hypothetical protein